jgi:phage terminase large subunit
MLKGKRIVGVREVQRSIKDSVKQLIEDKIQQYGLAGEFDIVRDEIRGPNRSLMIFRGLQDHTAASIKSLEGFDVAWIEEAQTISQKSLELLTPTIRKEGAEIWATWNPENEHDPIDVFLRQNPPEGSIVVQANWQDNPWFPVDLRADMERDKAEDPEKYQHVWAGGYRRISEGAYYAKQLAEARSEGRICRVPVEHGPPVHVAFDIGIDDQTALWFAQIVGREVHIIDYYESSDEDALHYARVIKDRYQDIGDIILPHDGGYREKGSGKDYAAFLREAGLAHVRVLQRTNDLAADINATRAFLAKCWIDEPRCAQGLKALGSYRREWDDRAQTFKPRPVHDWASHGADAFRYLAIGLKETAPRVARAPRQRMRTSGAQGWMAA